MSNAAQPADAPFDLGTPLTTATCTAANLARFAEAFRRPFATAQEKQAAFGAVINYKSTSAPRAQLVVNFGRVIYATRHAQNEVLRRRIVNEETPLELVQAADLVNGTGILSHTAANISHAELAELVVGGTAQLLNSSFETAIPLDSLKEIIAFNAIMMGSLPDLTDGERRTRILALRSSVCLGPDVAVHKKEDLDMTVCLWHPDMNWGSVAVLLADSVSVQNAAPKTMVLLAPLPSSEPVSAKSMPALRKGINEKVMEQVSKAGFSTTVIEMLDEHQMKQHEALRQLGKQGIVLVTSEPRLILNAPSIFRQMKVYFENNLGQEKYYGKRIEATAIANGESPLARRTIAVIVAHGDLSGDTIDEAFPKALNVLANRYPRLRVEKDINGLAPTTLGENLAAKPNDPLATARLLIRNIAQQAGQTTWLQGPAITLRGLTVLYALTDMLTDDTIENLDNLTGMWPTATRDIGFKILMASRLPTFMGIDSVKMGIYIVQQHGSMPADYDRVDRFKLETWAPLLECGSPPTALPSAYEAEVGGPGGRNAFALIVGEYPSARDAPLSHLAVTAPATGPMIARAVVYKGFLRRLGGDALVTAMEEWAAGENVPDSAWIGGGLSRFPLAAILSPRASYRVPLRAAAGATASTATEAIITVAFAPVLPQGPPRAPAGEPGDGPSGKRPRGHALKQAAQKNVML